MSKVVKNSKNIIARKIINHGLDLVKELSEDFLKDKNPEAHEIVSGIIDGAKKGVNNVMVRNSLELRQPIMTVTEPGKETIKPEANEI